MVRIVANHQVLSAVHQKGAPGGGPVALLVGIQRLPIRRPPAHVQPLDGHRHRRHRHPIVRRGGLHHRKIDADLLKRRVNFAQNGLLPGRAPRLADLHQARMDLRPVTLDARQQRRRTPNEHAAVPGVPPRLHVPGSRGSVRLLHKLHGGQCLAEPFQRLAHLDVAVARGGVRGPNAERHQCGGQRLGDPKTQVHALPKHVDRLDQMVGREHGDHRLGVLLAGNHRRQAHRRQRVAPLRLAKDLLVAKARHGPANRPAVLLTRRDQPTLGIDQVVEPIRRNLQKRLAPDQPDQLLGKTVARHRPKPSPGTARKNHSVSHSRSTTGVHHAGNRSSSPRASMRIDHGLLARAV